MGTSGLRLPDSTLMANALIRTVYALLGFTVGILGTFNVCGGWVLWAAMLTWSILLIPFVWRFSTMSGSSGRTVSSGPTRIPLRTRIPGALATGVMESGVTLPLQ